MAINGYIYDPYGSSYLVPIGAAPELVTGPQVPASVVSQAVQSAMYMGTALGGGTGAYTGLSYVEQVLGLGGAPIAPTPSPDPTGTGEAEVLAAGGLGMALALIARVGWGIAGPLIRKYWPHLLASLAGLGIGTAITGAAGVFGGGAGEQQLAINGIPLGGPFAPEPPAAMIAKEWAGIGGSRFYLLVNGRIAVRRANGTWKLIKRVKMLHMKTSNPRMGDVVRADRVVARAARILRRRLGPGARRRKN